MTEAQLQSRCFQWAWNHLPQTRGLLFHVPNGGKRNAREAMKFKAMGVLAGIPDMPFLWAGKLYAFEFKIDDNSQSPDQQDIERTWTEHGAEYYLVRDEDTFQSLIKNIVQ